MQGHRPLAAAGAALIGLALAGCIGGDGSDEAGVATATDDTEVEGVAARCVVADPEGELVLQPGSVAAVGPARLVSVALEDPVNLEVVEGAVTGYRGPPELQGVLVEYPPRTVSYLEGLADWERRRPLAGLMIRPREGRQVVLVAVRLAEPDRPGHLRGVTLRARTRAGPRTIGWEQLVLAVPAGEACTPEVVAGTTEWTG